MAFKRTRSRRTWFSLVSIATLLLATSPLLAKVIVVRDGSVIVVSEGRDDFKETNPGSAKSKWKWTRKAESVEVYECENPSTAGCVGCKLVQTNEPVDQLVIGVKVPSTAPPVTLNFRHDGKMIVEFEKEWKFAPNSAGTKHTLTLRQGTQPSDLKITSVKVNTSTPWTFTQNACLVLRD